MTCNVFGGTLNLAQLNSCSYRRRRLYARMTRTASDGKRVTLAGESKSSHQTRLR